MFTIHVYTLLNILEFLGHRGPPYAQREAWLSVRGRTHLGHMIQIRNGKLVVSEAKLCNLLPRVSLLGMVAVFQENSLGKHVKFVFAWKTLKQFPMQTKRKHNKIIPSVCV